MSVLSTAALPWVLGAAGVAAATYGALAADAWYRYGSPEPPRREEQDSLLDEFMPRYDTVERHRVRVHAPASVTLQAAADVDLFGSWLVRTVFRTREAVLGADRDVATRPIGLMPYAESLGWGRLAALSGREIVMGAVTQPWKSDVVFRALPPENFCAFDTVDFVKIAWTLRADPAGDGCSIFRTETRAVATDSSARVKFRRYWSLVSPGVWLIRRLMLPPIRDAAERRSRQSAAA
jgi:hypothetical protein